MKQAKIPYPQMSASSRGASARASAPPAASLQPPPYGIEWVDTPAAEAATTATAAPEGGSRAPSARQGFEMTVSPGLFTTQRRCAPGHAIASVLMGPEADRAVQVPTGGGVPLPERVRTQMEGALGMDFSAVRVHEGSQAAALGALAFTQGPDIHFAPGYYQPYSQQGQHLLGHELTHVRQQTEGRVRPTAQMNGVKLNDDVSLEREADEMGAKAAGGAALGRTPTGTQAPTALGAALSADARDQATLQRYVAENPEMTAIRVAFRDTVVKGEDALELLAQTAQDIQHIPDTLHFTKDWKEFVFEYAKYLSVRERGDESIAEDRVEMAETNLKSADCRGFTNQKSETWYYDKGSAPHPSDVIHEMIHIISAQGGLNEIYQINNRLNEGMTQYFTKRVCGRLKVNVNEAYTEPTEFVEKLDKKYGFDLLYQAYFKGELDPLYDAMVATWKQYITNNELGNGNKPGYADRKFKDDNERKGEITVKLKKWADEQVWIKARLL